MACADPNEKTHWIGNAPTFSIPWRRIFNIPDRAITPQLIAKTIQPVHVVGDTTYAAGAPGWRGLYAQAASPAVAARRSCHVLIAINSPFTLTSVITDVAGAANHVAWFITTAALGRSLIANDARITPVIERSGDPEIATSLGVSGVELWIGDADPVALPSLTANTAMALTRVPQAAGDNWGWPAGQELQINPGEALFFFNGTDNTAYRMQMALRSYRDWIGV